MNKQIIFVDSSVQDYQSLINNADAAQITNALANQKDISALHILSHGSEGSLNLSTEALNSHNLEKFSPQIKQWGKALTENADILLYGCEIGKGETGQNFVKRLSEITEANIAASATPTGSTELGGDWKLEVQTGDIKATIPFNAKALNTYIGVLGFATKADFTTGTNPQSVSIGDFNGDGKPDLAVANNGSNTASILLNTTANGATTPTFATKVDFTTGNAPQFVSIGDFNGDGKPDLAVANTNSSTVSILLNTTANGATTPTFAPKVDFTTDYGPLSVSIGDLNGDGKPDLAVAKNGSSTASVLLNTTATRATTPTFATKVDFTTGTGSGPRSVSIGDINGDGKLDLATANGNNRTASILLNTTATGATTPTFATNVDFTTGSRPCSVSIGDINGDGKPDLAVANYSSNTASIRLNTTAKVTAVTATSADDSYGVGATIAITVTFDAAVNVTGTPRLQLETGTTDRFATYNSGSGGNVLTFNYVVLPGDTSADLEYLSTSALTLNGGTIKETAASGWDAFLTLPTLATANSLGGSKAIVVDATAPTAPTIATTGTTNDNTPTITGTAEANSVVNILQGTTSLGTTTTDATGNWTFTPTTALTDATYSLTATATDAVGNVSTASRILSL
ncbi:integrin alpha chain [Planktothrix agardhii CCAP 1459/11A]|uniref:Integrin alpha chain n=1 Tax=Planktothrix agardhii CCAP 1459/11A TaxID=282420 RepID=A0A4P5ZAR7_PLAAG|nr:FG-GAP-like repeat-containing protein [Planktothrix agardhii]GDZ92583.1 integrin alpha chain [Planktothrix agardhii CCAP 1459/11A]